MFLQMFPQYEGSHLIGQMCREAFGFGVIEVTSQSDITMVEEDHEGSSAGDQHVGADIELLPLEEQRPLDVPEDEDTV